jgi:hypothetical protein
MSARTTSSKQEFVDVVERKFKLPARPWSSDPKMKQIGLWNMMFFLQDTEVFYVYLLCKVLVVSGLSPTQIIYKH